VARCDGAHARESWSGRSRHRGQPERPAHGVGRSLQAWAQRTRRDRAADRGQLAARARHPHAGHERLSVVAPVHGIAFSARHGVTGAGDSAGADRAGHAGARDSYRGAAVNSGAHGCDRAEIRGRRTEVRRTGGSIVRRRERTRVRVLRRRDGDDDEPYRWRAPRRRST